MSRVLTIGNASSITEAKDFIAYGAKVFNKTTRISFSPEEPDNFTNEESDCHTNVVPNFKTDGPAQERHDGGL